MRYSDGFDGEDFETPEQLRESIEYDGDRIRRNSQKIKQIERDSNFRKIIIKVSEGIKEGGQKLATFPASPPSHRVFGWTMYGIGLSVEVASEAAEAKSQQELNNLEDENEANRQTLESKKRRLSGHERVVREQLERMEIAPRGDFIEPEWRIGDRNIA